MERFTVKIHDIHGQYLFETQWNQDSVKKLLIEETSVSSVVTPLMLKCSFVLLPSKDIVFKGHLKGSIELTCVRCLNDFTLDMDFNFKYLLCPGRDTFDSANKEVNKEDIEKSNYNSDYIDLRQYIVEQICLNLPDYAHCREDCRGLCHICGTNLNESRCFCMEKALKENSPFSKLETLKKQTRTI